MFPHQKNAAVSAAKGFRIEKLPIILLLLGALLMTAGCKIERTEQSDKLKVSQKTSAEDSAIKELKKEISEALSSGDGPHIIKLKNGMNLLIKEDTRFPLVNVRLFVHAGSSYETPDQAGISHLLEHMVFKGTDKRAPGQTALEIESVGGDMNAATSFDYTVYYVEVPENEWKLGMDIVTDMAFNAKIDPEELKSERDVVLSELERGEDNPGSRIFKTLQSIVWKDSSYQWPIIGYRETVEKISSEDIHAYIDRLYQPQSMLLSVVGKIDPQQVALEAEKLCGSLEATQPVVPPVKFATPENGKTTIKIIPGKWNKVYIGAAFPIPGITSAKVAGLETLCELLGGGETSKLYRKFKYEKRMVDSISVSSLTLQRSGMLYIFATLDADKVEEFWKELIIELSSIDFNQFTDREMERVSLNLEDSLFLTKETLSGLASKLGYFQFFENGQQAEENYLYDVKNITRQQLQKLYDEYFVPEKLASCMLTPEGFKTTEQDLEKIVADNWPAKKVTANESSVSGPGEASTIELANGSKLVFIPDTTLPYTAMSMYWSGGDADLTVEDQGLSALVSQSLTRGTASMNATELEDYVSDRAASIGASAGREVFAITSKFPSRFTADMFPLIKEILTAPRFAAEEIDRAKQDQISSIKRKEDRPVSLAFRNIFPFLFKNGTYSYYHLGVPANVENFTEENIRDFWAKQSSRPFVIAVCGDYDREALMNFAKELDAKLVLKDKPVEIPVPDWGTENKLKLTLPDRNQAHLMAIFPIPGMEDEEATAGLSLLRAALAGQSGLLFRDLRDKQGLGYTVTAFLWQAPKTGFMAFYIGTKPEQVEQAMAGFEKTVAMLQKDDLPEKEIQRAKNILNGEYYQEHQSLLSRSRESASLIVKGFEPDLDLKLIEKAGKMNAADVRILINKYLDWNKKYTLTVQP
ncbi:pitrilysin family protein [Maridesulfovibrio ferrireducens]|uniref:M16 family metallopeptidase n=1 Tax=Maridesulfovibrio ferrireducens TaxID=246191 RepID=UPI001A20086E|nr:pitrilysin family protein [Maridesulfovibrio ferrireducens]MBI9110622.1 insulinase family protein [Maridesulfovibrio ferrireducens]